MSLVLSIVIGVLLLVLFIKLIKTKKDNDIFLNVLIPGISIITAVVFWIDSKFTFQYIEDYVYIVDSVLAIAYIILFFIKYCMNNKANNSSVDTNNEDN